MANYIHELAEWPTFRWDNDRIVQPLASVRYKQGRLQGRWEGLGAPLPKSGSPETLTVEATR